MRGAVEPGPAAQRVGAGAAVERVVARAATDRVVAGAAVQQVVAVAAVEDVRARPAVEPVGAGAAGEHHRAAEEVRVGDIVAVAQVGDDPLDARAREVLAGGGAARGLDRVAVAGARDPHAARLAGVGHAERHRARPAGGGGVGERGPGFHQGGRVGAAGQREEHGAQDDGAHCPTIWLIPPARRLSGRARPAGAGPAGTRAMRVRRRCPPRRPGQTGRHDLLTRHVRARTRASSSTAGVGATSRLARVCGRRKPSLTEWSRKAVKPS